MDPFMHYGVAAGMQAVDRFGHRLQQDAMRTRCGVDLRRRHRRPRRPSRRSTARTSRRSSPQKISPFFVPASIINMIAGHLSIKYGLKGPNLGVVTACTTSTHAIGLGMRTIQYGDADVMIAGGGEMATDGVRPRQLRPGQGALDAQRRRRSEASRPWDRDRDGFVLADGGGAVILEELEHAKKRGARIYAELVGFGMSGDAYHITAPPEDGEGARIAMVNALRDAQHESRRTCSTSTRTPPPRRSATRPRRSR